MWHPLCYSCKSTFRYIFWKNWLDVFRLEIIILQSYNVIFNKIGIIHALVPCVLVCLVTLLPYCQQIALYPYFHGNVLHSYKWQIMKVVYAVDFCMINVLRSEVMVRYVDISWNCWSSLYILYTFFLICYLYFISKIIWLYGLN